MKISCEEWVGYRLISLFTWILSVSWVGSLVPKSVYSLACISSLEYVHIFSLLSTAAVDQSGLLGFALGPSEAQMGGVEPGCVLEHGGSESLSVIYSVAFDSRDTISYNF